MTDILIVTWDGGGNVPPALLIGAELRRRGHGVRVLGHATQQAEVEAAGLEFHPFATAKPFSRLENNAPPRMLALFTDRAIGRDTVTEARRQSTDVVLVDALLVGAVRACADAGLPYLGLEHLFDGYLRGSWLRGPMGLAARITGLRPVAAWDGAAAALAVTLPELDPGSRGRVPANLVFTGPVLDLPTGPRTPHPGEPAVLISLSTYAYGGMTRCLQNLLDATAGLPARVIVTTGPVIDPADLRTAPNHEVHRFVPHDELMPSVDLVVGHGGHATTMRALAHDLPLVLMPLHPMLDQPLVGRAVVDAGAGAQVSKKAGPEQLRPVIERLLSPGQHRDEAARLGAAIRSARGTERAADEVLSAAGVRAGNGA